MMTMNHMIASEPSSTCRVSLNVDESKKSVVFDASVLQHQSNIPPQFIWPDHEKPNPNPKELDVPLIDLGGFLSGDPIAFAQASNLVGEACRKHGFFLVVNHGIDPNLISNAHSCMDKFFVQPLREKQRALRKPGEHCGYASSFTGRFSTKLPWKETLSFEYSPKECSLKIVEEYFQRTLGDDFTLLGYAKIICQYTIVTPLTFLVVK